MARGRRLSVEEDAWLRHLWPSHSAAEIAALMNGWFGTERTSANVSEAARTRKLGPAGKRSPVVRKGSWLTPAVETWLRAHIHERSLKGSAEELRRVFGIEVTVAQLNRANSNHKFGRANRHVARPESRLLSDEEIAWLRREYPKRTPAETLALFNSTFGRSLTREKLKNAQSRHGLGKSLHWKMARFQPGEVRAPLSAEHKKAFLDGGRKTRFQKGHAVNAELPMYTERYRVRRRDGREVKELMIKVPGPHRSLENLSHRYPSHYRHHWIRKAVWVWEQANGPVPKGHAIIALDGDELNCDPANLECVPRGVLSRLNHFSAPRSASGDRDGYRVRVRRAQLQHKIAERLNPDD